MEGNERRAGRPRANPYAAAVRALGRTRVFAWLASRVLPPLDRRFAGRRRSVTSFGTGFPLCYLTVRDRRSGEPRTVPLLYLEDGDRVVLVASNFGRKHHPGWARDLEVAATATVTIAGRASPMRARRADGAERARYWAEAVRVWPGYEGYRRRAGREIRLYVLEPYP
jgi:deazaflavin-dependent oxidoreductase (nitroreductase family)